MQIQADVDFAKLINEANAGATAASNPQELISDLYTSPQNKKAIRQVLLVVKDIQDAMHGQAPAKIHVEFARGEERNPQRSVQRQRQLEAVYEKVTNEILKSASIRQELKDAIKDRRDFKDRLYLYFLQGGRDVYDGKPISIDNLSTRYDIDHILPQAFIKDNSLNNRVLTSKENNLRKADNVPIAVFGFAQAGWWKQMLVQGLITREKYRHLMFNPDSINANTENGFIHRQLVETRQVIKLATNILADKYKSQNTQIISIKADLSHQMRNDFELLKNRDVNDYHHAFDAYLAAFEGNYLLKRYPKLQSYFVYGDFKKFTQKERKLRRFNFLYDLKYKKEVVDEKNGKPLWNKKADLDYIRKLFGYKKILVSHEVSERHGALYNQTVYKASDDKASGRGTKKLIRLKADKPTELYGGYTSRTLAYMAIVKLMKGKQTTYKVVGVPTTALIKLANVEHGSQEELDRLYEILRPEFTHQKKNRKTGKITQSVDDFEIVVPRVKYQQLVLDEGKLFMIGSDTYRYNAQQLVLSNDAIKAINNVQPKDKKEKLPIDMDNERLIAAFDEIMAKINKFFPMYDINQFRSKLNASRDVFLELPVEDQWKDRKLIQVGKRTILIRILQGLHANATFTDLKLLGLKTSFGFMQQASGITLGENAQLIYQSPTGLFEKRVQLNKIG